MKKAGFTMIELLVTFVVLGIMVAIAIPVFSHWMPEQRLRAAAREVYATLQMAKLGAVRTNSNWAVVFNRAGNSYGIYSDPGADGDWTTTGDNREGMKPVNMTTRYETSVSYGHGNAGVPLGGAFDDDIEYTNNVAVFNPRGTCSEGGYVYLDNTKNQTAYGIGTRSTAGAIIIRKWDGAWQ